uniref:Protein m140 n=1 Tax=Mastomys natalensis cytomegalovirus 1 TaxID=2973541 RepID=A0A9Y1N6A4_9BETA|nr:protein m140 [Mastomys natalensis cytomegalovirus 1]WEG68989.1 protein m140 [Mastomys natalensis cytomegalovirus 1]WEG71217.1 protein m140 [Mastomys natalensis cytomegalovirus 1]
MDTTWEALPVTGDPSPYRHATRSSFLRVMAAFKDFYRAQGNHNAMREIVRKRAGDRLELGIPSSFYVQLIPKEEYVEMRDIDLSNLVCCKEKVTVLGRIVIKKGDDFIETSIALCIGSWTRIYTYEQSEDALVLVAPDLDKLARFGLIHCESIYRTSYLPQATVDPPKIVAELLLNQNDPDKIMELGRKYFGVDVTLYTPGYRYTPMKLISEFKDVTWFWPFNAMRPDYLETCKNGITTRLCCRWHAFAVTGAYSPGSFFNARHVLIMDRFSVIYTLDTLRQKLYRLADNMTMLMHSGLCKDIAYGARFDRKRRNEERVESCTICPHGRDSSRENRDEKTHDHQFQWLCRNGRFRSDMTTWDCDDKRALIHSLKRQGVKVERCDCCSSDEYDDSDSDDSSGSYEFPVADDGSRKTVWREERAWIGRHDLEPAQPELLTRYMTEVEVSLQEVQVRRYQERQASYSTPCLAHALPALLIQ